MRTTINRRTFLRTAASASAVAASAGAVTIAAAVEHPDADLIALGAEFDRLLAEWKDAEAVYNKAWEPVEAIFGPSPFGTPRFAAWKEGVNAELSQRGIHELARASDNAYEAAQQLAMRMIDTPAATVYGLAAKAKALKFDLGMVGNAGPREEWDTDKDRAFAFLCEIEAMALAGRA